MNFDNTFPFVSVIIPARNEKGFISSCIRSLLNQDYPREQFEIIAVDNGSTDETALIIYQFPVRYVFEKKPGAAAARNAGARVARGEFLVFSDADCVVPPDWISRLVWALKEDSADACGGDCLVAPQGSLIQGYLAHRGFYSQKEFFSSGYPFPPWLLTGNLLVRKSLFEGVGGFEETLLPGEDMDLSWRMGLRGGVLRYLPELNVRHQRLYSFTEFFTRNFRVGKIAHLLQRRYRDLFHEEKSDPRSLLGSLVKLLRELQGLPLRRKIVYLFLAFTGHLSFRGGKLFNRILYDFLKRPLPTPVLPKEFSPFFKLTETYPIRNPRKRRTRTAKAFSIEVIKEI